MPSEFPKTIAVLQHLSGWRIVSRERRWGRFQHKVDAEEAALRLAEGFRRGGGEVEVIVQGRFGELEPLADGRRTA